MRRSRRSGSFCQSVLSHSKTQSRNMNMSSNSTEVLLSPLVDSNLFPDIYIDTHGGYKPILDSLGTRPEWFLVIVVAVVSFFLGLLLGCCCGCGCRSRSPPPNKENRADMEPTPSRSFLKNRSFRELV